MTSKHIRISDVALTVIGFSLLTSRIRWALTPSGVFEFKEPQLTIVENLTPRIPLIIHQSYKTTALPKHWESTPTKWQETNPEFEYKFWSDEDNRNLIVTHYPWFLDTFDSYPFPIQRADAARYFAVLKYGGIYTDLDIVPRKDVSKLIGWLSTEENKDKEMLVAETYNLGLTNALFAAIPNSKLLNDFVHDLPNHQHPFGGWAKILLPHFAVIYSAGPTRFWIFLMNHMDKVTTLAPSGWGQCNQCRGQLVGKCLPQPTAYFETTQGGSWHKWDTIIMDSIFCRPQFFIWFVVGALTMLGRYLFTSRYGKHSSATISRTLSNNVLPLVGTKGKKPSAALKGMPVGFLVRIIDASCRKDFHSLKMIARDIIKRRQMLSYLAVLLILRMI